MWRRWLGAGIVLWGLAATAYLAWCQHRVSVSVLMEDRAWPRPWPYPDGWLSRWHDRIDAEYPVPPGFAKMEGEIYRLQGRVRAWNISAFAVVAAGVALLLWPVRTVAPRSSSIRCGVSIGLVLGASLTALGSQYLSQRTEGPPWMWLAFAVCTIGFAQAGAVIGAVRRYPEFVGLCAGVFTIALFAGASLLVS